MRVLAISGSLRADSNNSALLRALREEAPEGVEVEIWHGLKTIPPYDQDEDVVPGPEAVQAFRELVRDSDAVFFATPEYNSSVPGALKNALDWGSRPLATNAFRKVLAAMGARVTEAELSVGHVHEKFADDGSLADDDLRTGLRDALETLVTGALERIAAA